MENKSQYTTKTWGVGKLYMAEGWYGITELKAAIAHIERMNAANKKSMYPLDNPAAKE